MDNVQKSKNAFIKRLESHPELLVKEQKHGSRKKESSFMNELYMYHQIKDVSSEMICKICGFQIHLDLKSEIDPLSNLAESRGSLKFHFIFQNFKHLKGNVRGFV